MRRRVREITRPAFLFLLLAGVFSARLTEGLASPDLLGSLVSHPGQYLESGIFGSQDSTGKQIFSGSRRLGMPLLESAYQGSSSRLKCPSVAAALTDGGGSLQLCLLLLFCAAVLCCASMSISPWCKSDSFLVRKFVVGLNALAAVIAEKLGSKVAGVQDCLDSHLDSKRLASSTEGAGKISSAAQTQSQSSKTSRKSGKKRRGKTSLHSPQLDGLASTGIRALEKTLSASSSAGEASSVFSGDTDADCVALAAREDLADRSTCAPADAQIARLEAEAARQRELQVAKSKRTPQRQAEASPKQDFAKQKLEGTRLPSDSQCLLPPEPHSRSDRERPSMVTAPLEEKKGGPHGKEGSYEPKTGKRDRLARQGVPHRGPETGHRDRLGRKVSGTERSISGATQVLVVPRKLSGKAKVAVRTKERETSDEDKETSATPTTPNRSNSSATSTFSSPHSSIYSPHHLSRPYAQVARGDFPAVAVPPPPPPPPRISTLPPGAVYAREFVPASHSPAPSPNTSSSNSTQNMPVLGGQYLTPLLVSVDPHSPASSSAVATSSPMPSPFPGMSLHRRTVPLAPSGPYSSMENATNTSSSAFNSLKGGLGFPGVFDNIWSSTAVGGWTLLEQQSQPQSLDSDLASRTVSEHWSFEG